MPGFSEFLVTVLNDAALRAELLQVPDLAALIARTVEMAQERGIELSEEELQAIVNQNRRSWLERWTDR
jgi:hypothetical protein